jgi:hypothetical protein
MGKSRNVTYMLRRTLCPWNAEGIVAETLPWCVKQRVDEIMWITESSGMYKELLPLPEIRKIVGRLHAIKAQTEAAGIAFSLNPLTTIGHGDYGNNVAAAHPGLEMMVDYKGGISRSCACPLSPVWSTLMRETFALYATTQPVRLWVEDDFRYFNHSPKVSFGCYCPRHLAAFGRRLGQPVEREALVAAILRPGEPHPWRAAWLDFMESTLLDVAVMLRDAVQAVSPATELGWMPANPGRHDIEGRRMGRQMEAFAGGGTAAIRMSTTHFKETSPMDLLIEDEGLKMMVPQLPASTTRCIEVETIPHSAYNASAARIAAQIEWACILGIPNHTMNIFDYLGTPLAESPAYDDMLRHRKDEFAAFAGAFADLTTYRGIGLPGDPGSSRRVRTVQGENMVELMAREGGWIDPLRAFGMPIYESKEAAVTAVTGQGLVCMSPAELEAVFSRGVLLDASALTTLQEMGRADLAGVCVERVVQHRDQPLGPEELTDPAFAGGLHRYTWMYGLNPLAVLKPADGARSISRVVNTDGGFLHHGVVIHENALGGRVATVPFFCQGTSPDPYQKGPASYFYTPYRRQQFQALLRWLGRGAVPLVVHSQGWTLPHRADGAGRIGLAAMNVNADPWNGVPMTCSVNGSVGKVEWLDIDGTRRELERAAWRQDGAEVTLTLDTFVPTLRAVAALLELK